MSKGSARRPGNAGAYDRGYERIRWRSENLTAERAHLIGLIRDISAGLGMQYRSAMKPIPAPKRISGRSRTAKLRESLSMNADAFFKGVEKCRASAFGGDLIIPKGMTRGESITERVINSAITGKPFVYKGLNVMGGLSGDVLIPRAGAKRKAGER